MAQVVEKMCGIMQNLHRSGKPVERHEDAAELHPPPVKASVQQVCTGNGLRLQGFVDRKERGLQDGGELLEERR